MSSNFQTIEFIIPKEKILNSNSMPSKYIIKSLKAAWLREEAGKIGVELHKDPQSSRNLYSTILLEKEVSNSKGRLKKKMNKRGDTVEEINEAMKKVENDLSPEISSSDIKIDYMFNKFEVLIEVYPPTGRRFDPPNLGPTVKPMIDGLTDAGWWEDDDHTHLTKTSFTYGGVSGVKDHFKVVYIISEIN